MQTNYISKATQRRRACSECHTQETTQLHYNAAAGVILCNGCSKHATARKASKQRTGNAKHEFITNL